MVTAQSLWKVGLGRIGVIDVGGSPLLPQLVKLLKSWRILAGIGIFGISSLLWFDLLSRMELSLLYPMVSFVYVIAFFVGWFWLGETPSWSRLLGIVVICGGIYLTSRTA
jgi:drug/metabolite transporter (DMT)-like permease